MQRPIGHNLNGGNTMAHQAKNRKAKAVTATKPQPTLLRKQPQLKLKVAKAKAKAKAKKVVRVTTTKGTTGYGHQTGCMGAQIDNFCAADTYTRTQMAQMLAKANNRTLQLAGNKLKAHLRHLIKHHGVNLVTGKITGIIRVNTGLTA